MTPIIVAGLGNPGEKYKNTRHNTGFMVVNKFAEKNNFPDFVFSKKFNALISEGLLGDKKVILVLPQTFMNESGKTIKKIVSNFHPPAGGPVSNLIVVHDDIDLSLGEIKIVKNRGSAGHKGVESIIKETKSKDFIRIRIGIIPKTGKPREPENFVLKKFSSQEKPAVDSIVQKTVNAIESIAENGLEKTMNEYNK